MCEKIHKKQRSRSFGFAGVLVTATLKCFSCSMYITKINKSVFFFI
jgi:hypothetical protein